MAIGFCSSTGWGQWQINVMGETAKLTGWGDIDSPGPVNAEVGVGMMCEDCSGFSSSTVHHTCKISMESFLILGHSNLKIRLKF